MALSVLVLQLRCRHAQLGLQDGYAVVFAAHDDGDGIRAGLWLEALHPYLHGVCACALRVCMRVYVCARLFFVFTYVYVHACEQACACVNA